MRMSRPITTYSDIFLNGVSPEPSIYVAGTWSGKKVTPIKITTDMDSTVKMRVVFVNQRFLLFEETKALARNADALNIRAAIQNWVDLLGELGVNSAGIPVYPKVCIRSNSPIARKATLRNRELRSLF